MNIRQEKKYTFSLSNLTEVRLKILSSKFLMTQAFNNRFVNSIYLDSLNFDNYNENLAGLSSRSKARIRWYSKNQFGHISESSELVLEIKLRSNVLGSKLSYSFKLPNNFINFGAYDLIEYIRKVIPTSFLPHIDHSNAFTLAVSYEREYFEDFSKKIRATIDSNIAYAVPGINILDVRDLPIYISEYNILELKYPQDMGNELVALNFDDIDITPGRHSKYAVGLNTVLG